VTVPAAQLQTGYLSDQQWLEATNFWGPVERDMSNGEQAAGDGHTITIGGQTYAKGLGVHAYSDILFYNGGHCSSITSDVGVDDEKSGAGKVVFQIWADGRELADSGPVTWQDGPKTLTANIGNTDFVHLIVTNSDDGTTNDHADWAGIQATCGGSTSVSGPVVGGTVPATLGLTLGAAPAFGAFTPGVAKDYFASTTATVTSTAGDAALIVQDASPVYTNHLMNGGFALPQELQVRNSAGAYQTMPAGLRFWGGPTSSEVVPVDFKQSIGANDALRTGTYAKTLTFTLSTTSP
jgi:hypothetical protein